LSDLNEWWLVQFRRHLEFELNGRDPKSLVNRWLALNAMTWSKRGSKVTVEMPHHINHFLDDADVRSKDKGYAQQQWADAKDWIDARHVAS
jgi:hypothetical protein